MPSAFIRASRRAASILLAVLLLCALLTSCAGSAEHGSQAVSSAASGEAAGTEQAENEKTQRVSVPLSQAVSLVKTFVRKNYKSNCRVNYDETTVTIDLWPKGVGKKAFAAAGGDDASLRAWKKRVTEAKKLSAYMCQKLEDAGFPGMSVTVNLLNDLNRDNALLTVTGDTVQYNWVELERENLAAQQETAAQAVVPERAAG